MEFVSGEKVSDVWFSDTGSLPREELRLNILRGLSKVMAKFSCFTFDKIGSIVGHSAGSTAVGPCFDWNSSDNGSLLITPSGPFDDVASYLQRKVVRNSDRNVWDKAEAKIMTVVLDCLQNIKCEPGFVLSPPDFDSQNIMVDEKGTVTGFIDLDLAQTLPRFVGYCRYPAWITRDWDPLMYGWPKLTDSEDSPDTLQRYRTFYNEELGKALARRVDWKFTEKSHIVEAMWIAALHPTNRLEICRKLVAEALGGGDDVDALDILYDIGDGYYEDDWGDLVAALKRLV
jgi:hypothetical protein